MTGEPPVPTPVPVVPSVTSPSSRLEQWSRGLTLLTTSLAKLAGIGIGIHEALKPVPDSRVLALCAILLSGGVLSENLLLAVIDRFGSAARGQAPER